MVVSMKLMLKKIKTLITKEMKKLIITLLFIPTMLTAQLYTAVSIDPNVATGNKYSMNNKPTFNIKGAIGYTFNRLTIYHSLEYLPEFEFERQSLNLEYEVFKNVFGSKFSSTFIVGSGRIYRGKAELKEYTSLNCGGKIKYTIGQFEPFIEYMIDQRKDLPGDDKGHLKNKDTFPHVRSVNIGVIYRFD